MKIRAIIAAAVALYAATVVYAQYPTPTPRTGRVPVATYDCSPTPRALSQETPTPDEPTPTPLATDTATVTVEPSITSPPFPTATPSRTPTDILPTFIWPSETPEPTQTLTPLPTDSPIVVTVVSTIIVTRIVVVTATPNGVYECLPVRGRLFLPLAFQRRRH